MKFEEIIRKISQLTAFVIIYFLCAGVYLSSKNFVRQPDGNIVLIKEAHAEVDLKTLATPINDHIALTLPKEPVLGNPNAPITIYEFSSLNCSHCSDFHLSILPLLKSEFIDSGNVKLIFTHFPLDRKAMKAAMLSECVPAGNYHSFISLLFKKQREWMLSRDPEQTLIRYAMLNGMTEQQAKDCLVNDDLAKDLLDIRQQGLDKLEIKGTPAFLVIQNNHREMLYGAPGYRTFKAYLQSKIIH
ncbi:MAG: DsbA family protein [Alphaproteobacteria bacterium]|nr:DsbA family protein [Alphaproteobacteria bacterium]